MDKVVIELSTYRLKDKVTETDFLKEVKSMNDQFLHFQPGHIKRYICQNDNGGYTDIVIWSDQEAAKLGIKAAENSTYAAAFMEMIDFDTLKFQTLPSLITSK